MPRDSSASSAAHPAYWQGQALEYERMQPFEDRDRGNRLVREFQETTNYPRNDMLSRRRSHIDEPGYPPNAGLAPRTNGREAYAGNHHQQSIYEYGQPVRPTYSNVWRLLWLYPDIGNLTNSLLADIENGWDYDVAFLLKVILELQSTYRQYLDAPQGRTTAIVPGPGTLLSRDTVLKVVRKFAECLIPYNTKGFDDSICRELQFRVLATGLSLFTILDAKNIIHTVYHEIRKQLLARDAEIKNGRNGQKDVYGFGDGELLIRYSLDFLSNIPSDRNVNVTIFECITSLFFAAGLVYTFNGPETLRTLSVMSELPTKPHEWHKNFHELYCITLSAISLKRYASVVKEERDKIQCEKVSKNIAQGLIEKFDSTIRGEVEKLLKSRGLISKGKEGFSAVTRNAGAEAIALETHIAHALFYLINLLAREFGAQDFFKRAEDVCERFIVQSFESKEPLQMLRFKAYEVLLTMEKKRGNVISLERRNFSIDNVSGPGRSGFFSRKRESPEAIKNEIELARQRFVQKEEHESQALKSSTRRLLKRYDELAEDVKHYGYWREDQPSLGEPSSAYVKSQPLSAKHQKNKSFLGKLLPDIGGPFSQSRHLEDNSSQELESEPVTTRRRLATIDDALELTEPQPSSLEIRGENTTVPYITYEQSERQPSEARPMSPEYYGPLSQSPGSSPHLSASPFSRPGAGEDLFRQRRDSDRSYQQPQPQPQYSPHQPSRRSSATSSSHRSQYGRSSAQPRKTSQTAAMEIEKYKWRETSVDLDIYVDQPEKYKLDLKSRATTVVLSPDTKLAAFVYEREILIRHTVKGPVAMPHKVPLLTVGKKEGPFVCAVLSPTFLAAISYAPNPRVQIARHTSLSSEQKHFPITLPQTCFPQGITISSDSRLLAVGLRVQREIPQTKTIRNDAEIKIYALEELGVTTINPNFRYKPLTTLAFPPPTNPKALQEFPTTIAFSTDGGTLMAAGTATICTWKRPSPSSRPSSIMSGASPEWGQWRDSPDLITRLPIPGSGGKSITSLTPFLRATHRRPYIVVTSILSALPHKSSNFVSPLFTSMDIPSLRGAYPDETHLCRSAVGPDGFVGAFLTLRGRLRVVKYHGGGCGLKMEYVGSGEVVCGVDAEDKEKCRQAAAMGISGGNGEWGVLAVDRSGHVGKVKVTGTVGEASGITELAEQENQILEMGGKEVSYNHRSHNYGYELDAGDTGRRFS